MSPDKTSRCTTCAEYVERIQPHPGSQGSPTWRHVVPADHVAVPEESALRCQYCAGEVRLDGEVWRHVGDVASAPHPAKPKAVQS